MNRLAETVVAAMVMTAGTAVASTSNRPMVRIAEIEVDPAQLGSYKAILAEQQEASVRLEPGVLMLHSTAIAGLPTQIRLLEVYASRSAYEAHLKSPHFMKYKASTEKMVLALKLVETDPILLCAKSAGMAGGAVTCMAGTDLRQR